MSTALALIALIGAAGSSVIAWSLADAPPAGIASLTATGLALLGAAVGAVSLRRRPAGLGVVRWFVYAIALAASGQILLGGRFALGAFLLRFGAAVGVAGLALPARSRLEPTLHSTPVRVFDLLLGSLLVLAIGGELGLRIFSWAAPSPLFERPASSIEDRISMHALHPGTVRFGFPVSPAGFYDDSFEATDERVVMLVGGANGVGIVPYSLLYSTVAEDALPDTAVWNASVARVGPPGYLHLLQTVALPRPPDRVLIAIEAAADLRLSDGFGDDAPVRDALASWLDARNVLLMILPGRLATLFEERRELGRDPRSEAFAASESITTAAEIASRFPWTEDPELELPTFTEAVWSARVRRQAERAATAESTDGLFRALDACREEAEASGTPVALLVLPATWQVDDALWRSIAGDLDGDARDRPQTLLTAWAMRNGVPILDALPFLRATPPSSDGSRRLFHLRDDRLNARGNDLVGDAVAGFLKRLSEADGR